jgi:hypothetical protein
MFIVLLAICLGQIQDQSKYIIEIPGLSLVEKSKVSVWGAVGRADLPNHPTRPYNFPLILSTKERLTKFHLGNLCYITVIIRGNMIIVEHLDDEFGELYPFEGTFNLVVDGKTYNFNLKETHMATKNPVFNINPENYDTLFFVSKPNSIILERLDSIGIYEGAIYTGLVSCRLGTKVEVSFLYYSDINSDFSINLSQLYYKKNSSYAFSKILIKTDRAACWKRFRKVITLDPTSISFTITIKVDGSENRVWLDNLSCKIIGSIDTP